MKHGTSFIVSKETQRTVNETVNTSPDANFLELRTAAISVLSGSVLAFAPKTKPSSSTNTRQCRRSNHTDNPDVMTL